MAERHEPNLDRVREAMRDHDERQETGENPPDEDAPREEPAPEDGEDE